MQCSLLHKGATSVPGSSESSYQHQCPPRNIRCRSQQDDGKPPSAYDPAQTVVWGGRLPSTRRAVVGGFTGLVVADSTDLFHGLHASALGGNLGGSTSQLLTLDGGVTAGRLRLDVIFPVLGLKRCVDYQQGFEFTYPASWLADQTLLYRAAQRGEQERSSQMRPVVAPSALSAQRAEERMQRRGVEPVAAFGPAGSSGEKNVSVIAAPIYKGFTLQSLGTAQESAVRFLSSIAPPESGRTAVLLEASERQDALGNVYYDMEYTLKGPKFFRHNISSYASRDDILFTLNAQCPESSWGEDSEGLRKAAASFRLLPSTS